MPRELAIDETAAVDVFLEAAGGADDQTLLALVKALNQRLDDCIKLVSVRGDFVKKLETLRIEE